MTKINNLAAPCGIHCGMCPLNKALTDDTLRAQIARGFNMPLEKAACYGCRAVDGNCPVIGEQCATWICVQEKGLEFCSDCKDFPCIKLMPCADRADKRPHNIKIYSLALRKQKGDEVWENEIQDIYNLYFKGQHVIGVGPVINK